MQDYNFGAMTINDATETTSGVETLQKRPLERTVLFVLTAPC